MYPPTRHYLQCFESFSFSLLLRGTYGRKKGWTPQSPPCFTRLELTRVTIGRIPAGTAINWMEYGARTTCMRRACTLNPRSEFYPGWLVQAVGVSTIFLWEPKVIPPVSRLRIGFIKRPNRLFPAFIEKKAFSGPPSNDLSIYLPRSINYGVCMYVCYSRHLQSSSGSKNDSRNANSPPMVSTCW